MIYREQDAETGRFWWLPPLVLAISLLTGASLAQEQKPTSSPLDETRGNLDRDLQLLAMKEPSLALSPGSKAAYDRLAADIKRLQKRVDAMAADRKSPPSTWQMKALAGEVKKLEEEMGRFNPPAQALTDTTYQIGRTARNLADAASAPGTLPAIQAGIAELNVQVSALKKQGEELSDSIAAKKNTAGFERRIRKLNLDATVTSKGVSDFLEAASQLAGDTVTLDKVKGALQSKETAAQAPRAGREYSELKKRYAILKQQADELDAGKPSVAALERRVKKLNDQIQELDSRAAKFATVGDRLLEARGTLDRDGQQILHAQHQLERRQNAGALIKSLSSAHQELQTEAAGFGDAQLTDAASEARALRFSARVKDFDQKVVKANRTGQLVIETESVTLYPVNGPALVIPVGQILGLSYGREAVRWMTESDQKYLFEKSHVPLFDALNIPRRKYVGIKYGLEGSSTAVVIEGGSECLPMLKALLDVSKSKLTVSKQDAQAIPREWNAQIADAKKATVGKSSSRSTNPF